ncbi:DUF4397 domain-containing protein [Natronorubrum sp. DTA28]|uniref:DUF4397 domain-containing protein n=1 Tax=Natronorubrum sp. DTA28 TaxID=3447019 RepID=UPI003F8728A2
MTHTRRAILKSVGAMGAISVVSGSALGQQQGQEPSTGSVLVSVAHFSPDAPPVDFYFNDYPIAANIGYDEMTNYVELQAGTYSVSLAEAGETERHGNIMFDLEPGYYTVMLYGLTEMNSLQLDSRFEATSEYQLPEQGQSDVGLVHVSPDAPAVDVVVDGETVLFESVQYGDATSYIDLPAGTHTMDLIPSSESPAETEDAVTDTDSTVEGEPIDEAYPIPGDDPAPEPDGGDTGEGYPPEAPTGPEPYPPESDDGYPDDGYPDDSYPDDGDSDGDYPDDEYPIEEPTEPEDVQPTDPETSDPLLSFEFEFASRAVYTCWIIGYADVGAPEDRQLSVSIFRDGPTMEGTSNY